MALSDFPAALIALRDELGLSQLTAAERMGITTRTLQRYENGETAPAERRARQFLDRLRTGTSFPVKRQRRDGVAQPIATASRSPTASGDGDGAASGDPFDASNLLVIPGGGQAGAGTPRTNDGAAYEVVVITRAEVERVAGALFDVGGIRWFDVVGDSCVPDFQPGERVYYNLDTSITGDGYYVVSLDGEWIIKRVQRYAGGVLVLVPANPVYQPETLHPVRDAEPNTYRSDFSGATCAFSVVGKVRFNIHAR